MTMARRSLDEGTSGGLSPMQTPGDGSASLKPARTWPGVVGTLSVIFAVLGILCWGCDTGSSILTLVAPDMMRTSTTYEMTPPPKPAQELAAAQEPDVEQEPVAEAETKTGQVSAPPEEASTEVEDKSSNLEVVTPPRATEMIASLVSLCLSVWLLVAGIGLIRRRSWSVPSLLAWSWIRILVAVGWAAVVILSLDEQLVPILDQFQAEATKQGKTLNLTFETFRWITIGFILLMTLVLITWPVFLLIFLGRRRIRAEAASWGDNQFGSRDWDRV